jgi:hypothetical protein
MRKKIEPFDETNHVGSVQDEKCQAQNGPLPLVNATLDPRV